MNPQQEFDAARKTVQEFHPGSADRHTELNTSLGLFTIFKQAKYEWFEELPYGYLSPIDQKTGLPVPLYWTIVNRRRDSVIDQSVIVRQVLDWVEGLFKDPDFQETFGELNWMSEPLGGRGPQEKLLGDFLTFGPERRRTTRSLAGSYVGPLSRRQGNDSEPDSPSINPIVLRLGQGGHFETSPAVPLGPLGGAFTGTVQLMNQTHFFMIKSPVLALANVMDPVNVVAEVAATLRERFPFLSMDLHNAVWKFSDGQQVFAEEAEQRLTQ